MESLMAYVVGILFAAAIYRMLRRCFRKGPMHHWAP